ncbi:MAG: RNA-binding S4 domain-containing protein [Armatimonadota bacterium]
MPPKRSGAPSSSRARRVPIYTGTITLGAFLKWAGITNTGGGAKARIAARSVSVNGVVELRRGRQLGPGDVVMVDGGPMLLVVKGHDAAPAPPLAPGVS